MIGRTKKGKLKKGFRFAKGGRIVKAKHKACKTAKKCGLRR